MGKGSRSHEELREAEPLFAANSARGVVSVEGNPLKLIFREGNSLEEKRATRWGLIGGKVGLGECFLFRLEMELAQEAKLRIFGGRETIRPITTLHTPQKTIRNYPVWKIQELGFNTRGLDQNDLVALSNPLTVVFYCRAEGELPQSREGRKLRVINFSDPEMLAKNLALVKPRHRAIVELWVRHELFGDYVPPFIEYGKGVVGTEADLKLALVDQQHTA